MIRVTIDELQTLIREVPFVQLLGIRILEVGEGLCRLKLPFREQHLQYYGMIHGGVIAALADSAIYMAQTTLNGITRNTVTTEMKVNFLAPVREDDLYAAARILKNGRKIIYGDVAVTDTAERLVAHATVTYMRLDYEVKEE